MSENELDSIILELTLQNAMKYNGKPMAKTIIGSILGKYPQFRSNVKEVKELVENKVIEISSLNMDQIKKQCIDNFPNLLENQSPKEKMPKKLPKLDNVTKGKLKLRLPPEPSGYLHIGHAYAGFINYIYKLEYDGHLLLRFEDTNPKKVESEFYDVIKEAYDYLGIKYDKIIYESDNLNHYQNNGQILLENGNAYVCFCDVQKTRNNRYEGKECEHRNLPLEKNLDHWEEMINNYKEGHAVVRLKGDMKSTQETLRDPTIMRIVDHIHPRIGSHRIYPLYDFAVSIEDANVSHVLRSEEFLPKAVLQNKIRNYLNLPNPEFKHFSRLKVKNTPVSKRVIRKLIEDELISDWDDPRLSTIFGLRSRGIVPETMQELVYERRLSSSQSKIDWDIILAMNRKILDSKTRRFYAIINPIKLQIENLDRSLVEIRNHPKLKKFGSRKIETSNEFWINKSDLQEIKNNKTIRLKDFINIDITEIKEDQIIAQKSLSIEKNIPKIYWVTKDSLPLELNRISNLYLSDEEETINPHSMVTLKGFIDKNITDLKKYDTLQLENIGIACIKKINKEKVYLNLT